MKDRNGDHLRGKEPSHLLHEVHVCGRLPHLAAVNRAARRHVGQQRRLAPADVQPSGPRVHLLTASGDTEAPQSHERVGSDPEERPPIQILASEAQDGRRHQVDVIRVAQLVDELLEQSEAPVDVFLLHHLVELLPRFPAAAGQLFPLGECSIRKQHQLVGKQRQFHLRQPRLQARRGRFGQIEVRAGTKQVVPPAEIRLLVDDHDRQPRVSPLELLEHPHGPVIRSQLEKRDEETVRPEKVRHRGARVVERAELRNLHPFLRKGSFRSDANHGVALEEDDVAERGLRRFDLE